jgi:hypothetical protein
MLFTRLEVSSEMGLSFNRLGEYYQAMYCIGENLWYIWG